jgi:hypothetical protein
LEWINNKPGHPFLRPTHELLDGRGLAHILFIGGHAATRFTNVIEFGHFGFTNMPWIRYGDAAVFTGVGPPGLPGFAEMSLFCGNQATRLAFEDL